MQDGPDGGGDYSPIYDAWAPIDYGQMGGNAAIGADPNAAAPEMPGQDLYAANPNDSIMSQQQGLLDAYTPAGYGGQALTTGAQQYLPTPQGAQGGQFDQSANNPLDPWTPQGYGGQPLTPGVQAWQNPNGIGGFDQSLAAPAPVGGGGGGRVPGFSDSIRGGGAANEQRPVAMKSDAQMGKAYYFGEGGQHYGGQGQGGVASGVNAYNQNLQDARQRALADRGQALGANANLSGLINNRLGTNPFGAQYIAQTQGILQDARARQYASAVEDLRQMYAQLGRPLDPRMTAVLRMQMARDTNADIRNLQVDTAGKAFAANQAYVNATANQTDALTRILGNTNYLPGTQDLAQLLALARAGSYGAGGGGSGVESGGLLPAYTGDMSGGGLDEETLGEMGN